MKMRRLLPLTLLAFTAACSGCATTFSQPDIGPWRTPIHVHGFISCAGNTPIAWIRNDAATDPQLLVGVLAHETQHVLDIANAGGCAAGWAAYARDPLWFEARAYCAGAHASANARLAPPVEQQIRALALHVALTLNVSLNEAADALTSACFVQTYPQR